MFLLFVFVFLVHTTGTVCLNYSHQHIVATLLLAVSESNPDAKRLYDDIMSGYNKLVRPFKNVTDPVTVKFKLKLSQLIDVVSIN